MALTTTNGMSIDDLSAAPNGPGLAQQLGNQVDSFYGGSVAAASSLPASGKFVGQRVWVTALLTHAIWTGAAWEHPGNWSTITLSNSWGAFGGAYSVAKSNRYGGWVNLKGMIKHSTTTTTGTLFTLGPGSRPLETQRFDVPASGGVASIDVAASGVVSLAAYKASGDGSAVSLSPIRFLAEQ